MAQAKRETDEPVRTRARVRYPETDRMGVAHHTHFFVWFELGRTEWMRGRGCPYGELEEKHGIYFPVRRAEAVYYAPARYDELLVIETRLAAVAGARVSFRYHVRREGALLATGTTEHACVDRSGRPRRIPAWLRERLLGAGEGRKA